MEKGGTRQQVVEELVEKKRSREKVKIKEGVKEEVKECLGEREFQDVDKFLCFFLFFHFVLALLLPLIHSFL